MRSISERSNRIQEITSQMQDLTNELNDLLRIQDDSSIRGRVSRPSAPARRQENHSDLASAHFKPGDRLKILNNYRGQKGKTGIVTYTKGEYVHFLIEDNDEKTSRKWTNLLKIN